MVLEVLERFRAFFKVESWDDQFNIILARLEDQLNQFILAKLGLTGFKFVCF